jgi:subtilisin family serine protease/chitodextrinase
MGTVASFYHPMRSILIVAALASGLSLPAAALTLDLPVRRAGTASQPAPAYVADLVELRLSPGAAPAAAIRTAGLARADRLGVPAVDRLAARFGGIWFEPEFRGETPPPAGSREPDFTAFYIAHLAGSVRLEEALAAFRSLGEVRSASPIAVMPLDAIPNDSLWTRSTWYYQVGPRHDIRAPEAWDATIGDTSVVVAILDTGVVPYHPDLGGSAAGLSGQIWTNWTEAGGTPGLDDDGNGYVDDLHGWDFVNLEAPVDTLPGEDGVDQDNDPNDFVGHGTLVAGLVGALTNNGIGVAGMAWKVRLMPVRMGWAYNGAGAYAGEVRMDFAAKAIRYATRMGATVINCSWASDNTDGIDTAVEAAARAGVTVVSAAGNNNQPHYLAGRDDVLAVAATDSTDHYATFSNFGPYVDLSAPGVGIRSTSIAFPRAGTDSVGRRQPAYNTGVFNGNGTSFSAPLVSGAAALIQSRYVWPNARRLLTPRGVQLRLMESADDLSAVNPGTSGLFGAGRLNAYRALTEVTSSTATRTGASSIGAQVLFPSNAGPRVAYLASNQTLMAFDPQTQDTVTYQNAFGVPNGNLAAADLGGTVGTALFYATTDAGVFGFAAYNGLLPGSWPQAGSAPGAMSGPALGDLDGDGSIEVVSGGDDGRLWAWHADGSPVTGYPVATGPAPPDAGPPLGAPALSDLNGVPGAEVVIAGLDGVVYAFDGSGQPLAGWPVNLGTLYPVAPVITRLGASTEPTVLVAAGNQLHALSPTGTERTGFPATLGGSATQDPALGDIDGDGDDEIVVVTDGPPGIEVRDATGASLTVLNWPHPLAGSPLGPPVLGELSTLSPGPELLLMRNLSGIGGLLALERDGDSLGTFAKPGGAGALPSLVQADQDAALEVLSGTGTDSLFYIYDGGPGSSGAGPSPWPTSRGNFARTGSRLYAPPLGNTDEVPPSPIADLIVTAVTKSSMELRWTAPADDGPLGRASAYEVRRATVPLSDANFTTGSLLVGAPVPAPPASPESLGVAGLTEGTTWYFGIRSRDAAGRTSAMSNLLQVATLGGPPGRVVDLRVVVRTDSSVWLAWTATGDDGQVGRPRVYAVRAALAPLDDTNYVNAPLQRVVAATVDAGGSEYLVFQGLAAATKYWFGLKAVDQSGIPSLLSNVVEAQTEVGGPLHGRVGVALEVRLRPSRGTTEFYWQASPDGAGSRQSIHIFDVNGRRVQVLEVGTAVGGRMTWDGRDAEGRSVPAGVYYARLLSGSVHAQTRLVLLP